MTEIELKLAVPAAARDAVLAEVATADSTRLPLRAVYADTDDQRLAAAGFALRLRQEGQRCVQALKGRGDGLLGRLEHEVEVPPGAVLDSARHIGTPAGEALAKLLAGAPLDERYRTEILRTLRRVRHGGSTVELAFDEGAIVAGSRRLAVCELEFELIDGTPADLVALARDWLQRHGLAWDLRTKSERGHRLALGLDHARPLPAAALPPAGFAPRVQALLAHALACAAEGAFSPGDAAAAAALAAANAALQDELRAQAAAWAPPLAARLAALSGARADDPALSLVWLDLLAQVFG